jgi:hypothetical protein
MRSTIATTSFAFTVCLVAACGGSGTRGPDTASTSAPLATDTLAASQVVDARCDRQVRCNDIGPGKRYETMDVCTKEMGYEKRTELHTGDCPRGVRERALEGCMHAIKGVSCEEPLDSLFRLDACSKDRLCLKEE